MKSFAGHKLQAHARIARLVTDDELARRDQISMQPKNSHHPVESRHGSSMNGMWELTREEFQSRAAIRPTFHLRAQANIVKRPTTSKVGTAMSVTGRRRPSLEHSQR